MISDETSTMPVFHHPAELGLHYTELFGRLCLAQADVTQRLQYLACHLSMGVMENSMRQLVLQRDQTFYAADCVGLEERLGMLFDAGAEGCVTILRSYIEDFTNAHVRCLEAAFGTGAEAPPLRLLPFAPRRAALVPGLPGAKRSIRR